MLHLHHAHAFPRCRHADRKHLQSGHLQQGLRRLAKMMQPSAMACGCVWRAERCSVSHLNAWDQLQVKAAVRAELHRHLGRLQCMSCAQLLLLEVESPDLLTGVPLAWSNGSDHHEQPVHLRLQLD